MILIGHRCPSLLDTHVFLRSITKYTKKMLKGGNEVPDWKEIYEYEKTNYEKNMIVDTRIKLMIPIISLVQIVYALKK